MNTCTIINNKHAEHTNKANVTRDFWTKKLNFFPFYSNFLNFSDGMRLT